MACMTRDSAVTSSILPRELAEHLPPLADYAPPEDQSGATNIQVRDHWARTLRVAVLCRIVLCHRLENWRHLEMKRTKVATSLVNCSRCRTNLRGKFDATSEAMQMVTDRASGMELEHRLNSLQTSLTAIDWAITKYENILEDCRMQEEEACQEEVISQEWEEEEGDADAEMMEEGERDDGEPSGPQGATETEEVPPLVSAGDAVSPEEDAFLM